MTCQCSVWGGSVMLVDIGQQFLFDKIQKVFSASHGIFSYCLDPGMGEIPLPVNVFYGYNNGFGHEAVTWSWSTHKMNNTLGGFKMHGPIQ